MSWWHDANDRDMQTARELHEAIAAYLRTRTEYGVAHRLGYLPDYEWLDERLTAEALTAYLVEEHDSDGLYDMDYEDLVSLPVLWSAYIVRAWEGRRAVVEAQKEGVA